MINHPISGEYHIGSESQQTVVLQWGTPLYSRIGIGQVFVVDPEHRGAFEWLNEPKRLGSIERITLPNGNSMRSPNCDGGWMKSLLD